MNKAASQDEDEEESSEEEEDEKPAKKASKKPSTGDPAWKVKLAEQLPFLAKYLGGKKSNEDDTDPGVAASNEDATDANIKIPAADEKRKKIIRIVVVLGLVYLGLDMLTTEEQPAENAPATEAGPPKPSAKKLAREKAKKEAEEKAKAEAAAATGGETPAVDPTTEPTTDTTATTEPSVTEPALDPTTEPTTEPTEPTVADPSTLTTDPAFDDSAISDASAPVEGTAPEEPAEEVPNLDVFGGETATTDPTGEPTGEGAGTDQVVDGPKPVEGDMTEQILQDLEKQIEQNKTDTGVGAAYIDPPDYGNAGRGLVYNCKGKHWACIDGPSFKICQQNNSALKGQGKSKECYPDSVYQSDNACTWVQRQKITGNSKTDFCL